MIVRAIRSFRTRDGRVEAGDILDIQPEALEKLGDFVEVISDTRKLIGESLAKVDREGRPWPRNFFAQLPENIRNKLNGLLQEINKLATAGDIKGLTTRLAEWRELLLEQRTLH